MYVFSVAKVARCLDIGIRHMSSAPRSLDYPALLHRYLSILDERFNKYVNVYQCTVVNMFCCSLTVKYRKHQTKPAMKF